jgi:hypothetical protein
LARIREFFSGAASGKNLFDQENRRIVNALMMPLQRGCGKCGGNKTGNSVYRTGRGLKPVPLNREVKPNGLLSS